MDLSGILGLMQEQNIDIQSGNDSKEDTNAALLKLLSNLSNGETILSKVIGISENQVELDLGGGLSVKANKSENVSLEKGNEVFLQVEKHGNNKVALRPLYQNTAKEETAVTAIKQASIPLNDKSFEMVTRKMEYGDPIDKASLQGAYREINSNPQVPVKYIVDLENLNIPRTTENLKQYEAYMNMENSITEAFNDINETVFDELSNAISDISTKGNQSIPISDSNPVKMLDSLINFSNTLQETGNENFNLLSDDLKEIKSLFKTGSTANLEALETEYKDKESIPAKEVFKAVAGDLKENLVSEKLPLKEAEALVKNPLIKNSLKSVFDSQSLLTEETVKDVEEVKDLYDRTLSNTHSLLNAFKESGLVNSNVNAAVQNLNDNINFMNALNTYIPYVQIPYKGESGSKAGELYVFKNKAGLSSKNGSLSCFIHLDMEHLGPTDVYVTKTADNVTSDFKVADEESLNLIEENIGLLNKRINDLGYSFEMKASVNNDEKAPVETMMELTHNKLMISSMTFDARV